MTSANGFIDRTARHAGKLPLPRIVATMLGAAAAFFCFAMPQSVLDSLLGTFGVPAPVGPIGRVLFLLLFTALAAGLGWLVVTVAGGAGAAIDIEPDLDIVPAQPRRRSFNPSGPAVVPKAAITTPPAVRRGDAHPDAPPRRPIFADHDLAPLTGELPAADIDRTEDAEFHSVDDVVAEPVADIVAEPVEDKLPEVEVEPAAPVAVVKPASETPAGEEPFDLTVALPVESDPVQVDAEPVSAEIVPLQIDTLAAPVEPAPAEPAPTETNPTAATLPAPPSSADRSLGELMARLETGLERHAGDLPPPPGATAAKSVNEPQVAPEDALRQALEALQRMAARQR
jgi:hypothetical protein